jgi:hypothetical protein
MQHAEADAGRSFAGEGRLETVREPEPTGLDDLPLLDPAPEPAEPSGTNLLELWSDRPEAAAIPELLRPGEGVVCVGSGTIVRTGRLSQPRWLVVLTDRRVLCIRGAVAATRRIIDMPVGAIRSVERKGIVRNTLTLDTGYGNLRIGGLRKPLAAELTDGLQALMRAHEGEAPTAIPRARLPEAPGADASELTEMIGKMRTELEDLRARVAALELASGAPSV